MTKAERMWRTYNVAKRRQRLHNNTHNKNTQELGKFKKSHPSTKCDDDEKYESRLQHYKLARKIPSDFIIRNDDL
jgi:hypothetical protein